MGRGGLERTGCGYTACLRGECEVPTQYIPTYYREISSQNLNNQMSIIRNGIDEGRQANSLLVRRKKVLCRHRFLAALEMFIVQTEKDSVSTGLH